MPSTKLPRRTIAARDQWRRSKGSSTSARPLRTFTAFALARPRPQLPSNPDTFALDVTLCRLRRVYKELGVPELGFLLVCTSDFPFAEGLGSDIQLTRTQTIMQGATHCDFRYTREKELG